MDSHTIAWLVVVATVLLGLFALYRATRGRRLRRTRIALLALLAVLLLVPAPVPGYAGHYAPAFLVFSFEWLFQQTGHARPAGVILVASALGTLAVMLLVAVWRRRGRVPGGSGKPPGAAPKPSAEPPRRRPQGRRPVA